MNPICVSCKKECGIVWEKTDNGQRGCEPQGHYEEWEVALSDCCADEVRYFNSHDLVRIITLSAEDLIEQGIEPERE